MRVGVRVGVKMVVCGDGSEGERELAFVRKVQSDPD